MVSDSFAEDIYDTNGNTPAANLQEYNQEFEQGAVEGIGFNFSSGDCSTEAPAIVAQGVNCDATSSEPQVQFPAEDPWVTAVGATAIGIGKHGNYQFETGMGDSQANLENGTAWSGLPGTFIFGSGGGTSSDYTQPYYQKGVVPSALADTLLSGEPAAAPMREVPDVGMEGDLFLTTMVGFTQKLPDGTTGFAEQGYGGTSIACPLFSGVQADAQQAAGWPLGFANPRSTPATGPLAHRRSTPSPTTPVAAPRPSPTTAVSATVCGRASCSPWAPTTPSRRHPDTTTCPAWARPSWATCCRSVTEHC
ncbi:hypothetical protein GXW82_03810 [Streptacidiphilus sp. 4-A2]|nr:hypothetical protein [Streptacidiphilus sp. 4-A2]